MILSDIPLNDVIKLGNSKLPDDTAIFNINSATDCPNRGTSRCQVDSADCYAYRTENFRGNVLRYRRRQGDFWDSVGYGEFRDQFKNWMSCKRKSVSRLRFNVSGDIRNRQDIAKIDAIARSLEIPVYLYTASSHVDFSGIHAPIIQCSSEKIWQKYQHKSNFGRFKAVESFEDADDRAFRCPGKCKATDKNPDKCTACVKAKNIVTEIH